MHIQNRLLVVTSLLLATVPLGTGALLLGDVLRDSTSERLALAVEKAQDGYRLAINLSANESLYERIAARAKERMDELGDRKFAKRREIVELRDSLRSLARDAWSTADREEKARIQAQQSRDRLESFVREAYLRRLDAGADAGRLAYRRLGGETRGDELAASIADDAVVTARAQVVGAFLRSRETLALSMQKLHASAGDVGERLTSLEEEWEALADHYRTAQREYDRAEAKLTVGEDQMAEIRAITAEVQQEILRMQSDLNRIDKRLKINAERKLIQMGLREDRPGRYSEEDGTQSFVWPVSGPVSAGFHDGPYKRYFGVEHEGMDIVVPQGTPVLSAADGIVFLARDGGARGFSYILIGHRDGYATLYGHLSSFAVQAGQEVAAGEIIGYSGGAPGTHGAGPMTTASHLHLEVMKNGVHLDPRTVLP